MSAGVFVATNVVPTHKTDPSFRRRGGSVHIYGFGRNKSLAKSPNGAGKQQ